MKDSKVHKERTSTSQRVMAIIGAVLCVVFGFMLICNLTVVIKGTINPDTPPSVLGVTPMIVLSGSMSGDAPDHIEAGDLIFVTPVQPGNLKEGDIIAFMQGDTVITHRIIGIEAGKDGRLLFSTQVDCL